MGSALSCDKCPAASASTVFTFSEPLVLKLTEGIEPEPEVLKDGQVRDLDDREWMERIHCIDDVHSHAYGLTQEGFDRVYAHLQKGMTDLDETIVCNEKVKECYIKHPGDTLKCAEPVKEFVDRIDLSRLKTVKKKFYEAESTITRPNN